MHVINYLISPEVLGTANEKTNRPALIDPYEYYLKVHW